MIEAVPPIPADAGQIHQVVMNLVVNGAQAIGGAMGTVTIALRLEAEAPTQGGDRGPPRHVIHLSVRDIPAAKAPAWGPPSCMASSPSMAAA